MSFIIFVHGAGCLFSMYAQLSKLLYTDLNLITHLILSLSPSFSLRLYELNLVPCHTRGVKND